MKNKFEQLTRKHFKFLEQEFGFEATYYKSTPFSEEVAFKNETTGVQLIFEPRDKCFLVLLSRLETGQFPNYPIFIGNERKINFFYLNDLLSLRSPELELHPKLIGNNRSDGELSKVITEHAMALRQYGQDILAGDFSVFDELERIVRARAQKFKVFQEQSQSLLSEVQNQIRIFEGKVNQEGTLHLRNIAKDISEMKIAMSPKTYFPKYLAQINDHDLTPELVKKLRTLVEIYGNLP